MSETKVEVKWSRSEKWTRQSCFGEWTIETDMWGNFDCSFRPFWDWDSHNDPHDDSTIRSFASFELAEAATKKEDDRMEKLYQEEASRTSRTLCRRDQFDVDAIWAVPGTCEQPSRRGGRPFRKL